MEDELLKYLYDIKEKVWHKPSLHPVTHRARGKSRPSQPAGHSTRSTPHFFCGGRPKDISLPALQRLLGHDRLITTEIYLDFRRRMLPVSSGRNGDD
jgi:hypothetical protein